MKIINYKENDGKYNMDYDLYLINQSIENNIKEPILRFYGWSPACVSIGRNQSEKNINIDFCHKNNIDIVRRVTGGRGLLHDNEVTYSFICPCNFLKSGQSIILSYKEISSAIIKGFKYLDIELEIGNKKQVKTANDYCMLLNTGADISYKGKKLIGSAQYRSQNYILQHGSILFGYDKNLIENIFQEKIENENITCIEEINKNLTKKDIVEALKKGFTEAFTTSSV